MNKKTMSILLLMALSISVACADELRTHQFSTDNFSLLYLENGVGTIVIEPSDTGMVDIEMRITSSKKSTWYRKAPVLADMDLTSRQRGDRLHISFNEKDTKADWIIKVPENIAINIEQGVGTIDISGVDGPLNVELGVGAVKIYTSAASVGHIDLKAGVGDTKVSGGSGGVQSRAFVSSKTQTQGQGIHRISVEVGVGDVEVELI
jgi:hypothetical protein